MPSAADIRALGCEYGRLDQRGLGSRVPKIIAAFGKGMVTESSPIVSIFAQLKYNINTVNEYISATLLPIRCKPIFSKIVSEHAENNHSQFTVPGGLIGVGTKIDSTLCRADHLVGQVLGAVEKPPKVYTGWGSVQCGTVLELN
ncbi:uncharacterized protein BJ212DRAFT_1585417 [Suillus subaureus]|uniref:Uncharacterized protein n=1 Tax=Suillus subaureus TaxID=48587 RepID=A0A9P7EI78_9AGAM|nr:uncharacterized protein BJ212DRAFT_1585417 [Suillus subaureus]KAG1822682.1 hypothetical protein BJ212DRAFT_1585417 [Suillus subaureus]